jgi:hypothetical protein
VPGLHSETNNRFGWRGHNCSLHRLQSGEGSLELLQSFRGRLARHVSGATPFAASFARGGLIDRTCAVATVPERSISILANFRSQQDRELAREDLELPLQS